MKTLDEAAFPASQLIHPDGAFAMILQSFGGPNSSVDARLDHGSRALDVPRPRQPEWRRPVGVGLTLSDRGVFVLANQQDLGRRRSVARPTGDGPAAAGSNLRESVVDDRICRSGRAAPTRSRSSRPGSTASRAAVLLLPFEIHGRWVSSVRMGEAGVALAIAGNRDDRVDSPGLLPTAATGGERRRVQRRRRPVAGVRDATGRRRVGHLVAIGDDELLSQQRSLACAPSTAGCVPLSEVLDGPGISGNLSRDGRRRAWNGDDPPARPTIRCAR